MPLQLDDRQRAMLLEMGVRVWLPGTAFALDAGGDTAEEAAAPPVRVARPTVTPAPQTPATQTPAPATGSVPPPVAAPRAPAPRAPVELAAAPQAETPDWATLASAVAACNACGLCAGRGLSTLCAPTTTLQADWMVVGDPPDEDEDAQGQAFAGPDGELLDNMLKALALQRINTNQAANQATTHAPITQQQAAYVTSVVKCRPPHGVVPQAAHLAQCAHWLRREIALVKPRMILGMGRFANQVLLSETPELITQPLDRLRGRVHQFAGVPVVLTYHPKVLMRTTPNKAKAWADLCLAADTVEAEKP